MKTEIEIRKRMEELLEETERWKGELEKIRNEGYPDHEYIAYCRGILLGSRDQINLLNWILEVQ